MSSILPENVGYLVLIFVGLVMAGAVSLMVKGEMKWLGTRRTSEWFYTAGRTIKTGLIASSVVSAWTWAATLLQSSTVAYQFGISGPFWYAAGATIQVILFTVLAIELKKKAPFTHTFPEMIHARFGKDSHKIFLFFALMTNTIITAMLVLGGAAVVNLLTGIDISMAAFLIPVGIILYTIFGGLKATFFAEYLNSAFIFVIVLVFVSVIYFAHDDIGGIEGMYEKLVSSSLLSPVEGNVQGSYLTLASIGALTFGIINIVGNFGTVFVDQSYWQRAIASRPKASLKGFVVGGFAWFAIPFALASSLGLAAVAAGISLSDEEVALGLVAPAAASFLMGDVGAILILTIVFTAVTAAGSSQLVSVSSLITYDVYRTYLNPSATGRKLLRVSRTAILVFGVGMGVLAFLLFHLGLSLQYVYLGMGILIGPAVGPLSLGLLWKKTNKKAATIAPLVGIGSGLSAWLGFAFLTAGEISIASTGSFVPLLAGNLASILVGVFATLIGTLLRSDDFNFYKMRQSMILVDEKVRSMLRKDTDKNLLESYSRKAKGIGIVTTLALVVVFPVPLYASEFVFDKVAFDIWIWAAVVWVFSAASVIICLPILEGRESIKTVLRSVFGSASVIEELRSSSVNSSRTRSYYHKDNDLTNGYTEFKMLVPLDGSVSSIRALNYASYLPLAGAKIKIYVIHVIEWTDLDDKANEVQDEKLVNNMLEEGRRMLKSVILPRNLDEYERIVKLGNPPKKIVEMIEKLDIDMIIMGKKGIGNNKSRLGHVAQEVLQQSSVPVVVLR